MQAKVILSLIEREREYGLLYVAVSTVTKFTNLGIEDTEGLFKNRLCFKAYKNPKIRKHPEEENRLQYLKQSILK